MDNIIIKKDLAIDLMPDVSCYSECVSCPCNCSGRCTDVDNTSFCLLFESIFSNCV